MKISPLHLATKALAAKLSHRRQHGIMPLYHAGERIVPKATDQFTDRAVRGIQMIVGDPEGFAIESAITEAYEYSGLMALGYFVIHICGRRFGVKEAEATMLACSFEEVARRITKRGAHRPPFPFDSDAGKIANAFIRAGYEPTHDDNEQFFGIVAPRFREVTRHLEWAPDGDAAFDDGSQVLHLEDMENVRLIAYSSTPDYVYDPETLKEVWLSSEEFYATLQSWHDRFEVEWEAARKVPASRKVFKARD